MSKSEHKRLILIDGSSYLFRAYHALPPLTTSAGVPTGAVYGVMNMIKKLMSTTPFDYIAVVFDPKGKTFRHELFKEYKANRTVMPDELRVQIAPLHELIRAFGLPLIVQEGVEADDVIGTLARFAEKKGIDTLISTMDKDMAQLVNARITLINTMSDKMYDAAAVQEKFGVTPDQMIGYLALMGDASDNIPGVPKVGSKTAVVWLSKYKSLDNIVKHANDIPGKLGESFRAHLDDLALSKKLVTIQCDVTMDLDLSALQLQEKNVEKLRALFSELEFTSWLRDIDDKVETKLAKKSFYHSIQDEHSFSVLLEQLSKAKQFALDTETTDLDTMCAQLVGMSFCVTEHDAFYIPFIHQEKQAQLNREKVLAALKPLLSDTHKIIIGQNLKYDYKVLKKQGVTIATEMQDTLLESYVLNSTGTRHDLDTLALKYLSKKTMTFEEVAGKGAKQVTFDHVPIDVATQYAAEDADVTLQLHHVLMKKIHAEPATEKVLRDIEWPLMPILANMEYHGVLIDTQKLAAQSKELGKEIQSVEERAFSLSGETFNLASPKPLQTILFEKLRFPTLQKTPTGAASTDESVMQELALDYELPKIIVEHRQLSKLKSTYTDALPAQVNPDTHRVHTSYNQTVTSTGRLSSNNPNLQNIPIRREEGREIRRAFIAPKNHKIISADYSQIELRIMAHLSKDPGLLKAFAKKQDIHASTAAEVFGVDIHDVTPEMRRHAKAINFGLLYGMSSFGLSKQLGVSREQAQKYMNLYFERYPNVHGYMENARQFAEKNGYVETLLGRRLFIPDIHASNKMRKMAAERAAINAPLQGTAADIIKLAMICVDHELKKTKLPAVMIMQVHDELVFEADNTKVPEVCDLIKKCMENAIKMDVPLEIAIGAGDNWDEAH